MEGFFEELEPFRQQSASSGSHVFRHVANPNEVLVDTDWNKKEQGVKFGQSEELKNGMERAGVLSAPEITFS